jgi:hypothetical protein
VIPRFFAAWKINRSWFESHPHQVRPPLIIRVVHRGFHVLLVRSRLVEDGFCVVKAMIHGRVHAFLVNDDRHGTVILVGLCHGLLEVR